MLGAAHKPLNSNYRCNYGKTFLVFQIYSIKIVFRIPSRWKDVDDQSRQELEEKADFQGLIIMQNLVKEETYGAIRELHEADINTVMVTGDNILTAISVGRDCELVKPDQTVIRVEAELVTDTGYSQRLNVSYSLEENEKSNIVHDVRNICLASFNFSLPTQLFSPVQLHQVCPGEELRVRLRRPHLRPHPEPRQGAPRPDSPARQDLRQDAA